MSAKPLPTVINHIALYVSDLERSTRFYRHILQFPSIPEPFKIGRHSWFQIGTACQLHLIAGAKERPQLHINHHLAFSTAAFDDFVACLKSEGVPYSDANGNRNAIHVRPDGVRQVFFQDPDGYWLEVNDESIPTTAFTPQDTL